MSDPHTPHEPDRTEQPAQLRADPPAGRIDVVRHEEQLRTSTMSVPVQRVRLKKIIVTEEKTFTVQIRREELRFEHETLDPTTTVTDPGPSELELILHEERVTITREVVPIERIRLTRSTVEGQQPVTADVRHEIVDIIPAE
ncbi:DUF2382 domain-containing protein [Clavibacter michiganensis]|nr:DUF2382 domain-containing protein [Clavibacter michiganensis]